MEKETQAEMIERAKEAEKRIEEKLTERGVGSFWARLLAALIVAAAAVAVSVFSVSCSMNYTKLPDGTVQASSNVVLPPRGVAVSK